MSITAGFPETLAGGLGEAGDHCVPPEESAGGLPSADVHDAGRQHRGGGSGQRVAGAESGRDCCRSGTGSPRRKGPGFGQPPQPHQHRHIVEIVLERAKERYSGVKPRIISDSGTQFIAKDFKEFIPISGMTHVRTSPYYRNRTAKSNAGINHSKGSASVPERRCRLRTRAV
jgi:hypothetical protein